MSLESVTRKLTPWETQVLKAYARLDYEGSTNTRIRDTFHMEEHTVKHQNEIIFAELNVGDIFSAVAYALNNDIIELGDVVVSEEQLESTIKTIENRERGNSTYLTDGQYRTLRAFYTYSLETGSSLAEKVAESIQTGLRNNKQYVDALYTRTPASNRAQLAVIGYIQDQLIKGEDVRKQYKVSAQPAPG